MEQAQSSFPLKGFRDDIIAAWRGMPEKWFFLGLFAAWCCLFHFLGNSTFGYIDTSSLFGWMANAYGAAGADDDHGFLIPFVVGGLFWWKRKKLIALPHRLWTPALIGLLAAVLLHIFGYLVQQPRISIVAFFLGTYSLIALTWGTQWARECLFPFVLFIFCVPVSTLEIMKNITLPLRLFATAVSSAIANNVVGFGVIRQGTLLFDASGTYTYDIDAACSGIRSLISLFILMVVYSVVAYRSYRKRLYLVLASVPFAILCNVLRLLSVIIAAELFGQTVGNKVHDWSGFFTYAFAVISVTVLSRYWTETEKARGQTPSAI